MNTLLNPKLQRFWAQKHRYYHNLSHLEFLLKQPEVHQNSLLQLAAIYHDVIYDPRSSTNEEDSIRFMQQDLTTLNSADLNLLTEIILATKATNFTFSNSIVKQFVDLDRSILFVDPIKAVSQLLDYETKIAKEFQFVPWETYRTKRTEFLQFFALNEPRAKLACEFLINYLQEKQPRIGVYAGSFTPFHAGHLSILQEAEKMFDKVIVALGINPDKLNPTESQKNPSVLEAQNLLKYHQVEAFEGFLTVYLDQLENQYHCKPVLIRGIRNDTDFKYEDNQLRVFQDLKPDIQVIFIPTTQNEHISGSLIRSIKKFQQSNEQTQIQVQQLLGRYTLTTEKIYNL